MRVSPPNVHQELGNLAEETMEANGVKGSSRTRAVLNCGQIYILEIHLFNGLEAPTIYTARRNNNNG